MQESPFINIGLYLAYALMAVAAISAIAFPIIQTFGDLKKAKGGLLGFGLLIVILLIAFLLSPTETGPFYEKHSISPQLSKVIAGSLLATYLVFAGAIINILYAEVAKWFK
ncbi:MAG: hypothetical protein FD170_3431 [Bacteroidetes bacterium]|nr:MAG: hypothetical protein FD170_3431 [Bacteroidota bacterium]